MALITIHTFTSGGSTYRVKYDDVLETVSVSADPGPVASSVPEADLGAAVGQVLYWHCNENSTLIRVRATTAFPFARLYYDYLSSTCVLRPCDLEIVGVTVEGESEEGMADGEATVSVSTTAAFPQYSLDGFAWQTDNHFFGLEPGTYQLFVRDNRGCEKNTTFTITAGAAVVDEPYPWADKVCRFFRLLTPSGSGYTTTAIEEPGNWDKVNFVGKRDAAWHGYRGMWSDGFVSLEFDCAAGKELLQDAYDTDGGDAEVLFQYGYTKNGTDYVLFPGKINFNTYKVYAGKVVVGVEREDFDATLKNRMDVNVSMAEEVGYDGAPLVPPIVADFTLHAKEIIRRYQITSTQTQYYDNGGTTYGGYDYMFIQPDTSQPQLNEVETFYNYPLGFSSEIPYDVDKYHFDAKFGGTYDFHVAYSMTLSMTSTSLGLNYTIRHYWRVNRDEVQKGSEVSGSVGSFQTKDIPFSVSYDLPGLQLQAGDKVYIYTHVQFGASETLIGVLTQHSVDITCTANENTGDSQCKGWLIGDVVDHAIRVITNGGSRLRSTLLSLSGPQQATDGEAALNILTNGKQIRRFDVATSPLQVALKDLLDSMKAHWCIGWGTETIGRTDVVRIERADYFYQDNQICVIEEVDYKSYYKECAKDLLYNELEFGYEKFQDSGYNTLDEFNTRHEHVTPIKSNKLKLPAKSKFIASGYSIETSRREQYEDTPNDSVQNDDATFLIAVRRGSGVYETERNEAFQVVANLISPDTAYNLRHSPFRMLLNWAMWLKNVFHYKDPTEVIRNTFVAQNGTLETQFSPSEPRPMGDISRLRWVEKQDITVEDLPVRRRIFKPDYIYFRTRLTPDVVGEIHKAMRGGSTKDKNYGYIVVKNPDGEYDAGYLMEIEYNFYTEVAQFKLLERYEATLPVEECCPYLVVNGCYLRINGLKTVV